MIPVESTHLVRISAVTILLVIMAGYNAFANPVSQAEPIEGTASVRGALNLCIIYQDKTPCRPIRLWGVEMFPDSPETERGATKFLLSLELNEKVIKCKTMEPPQMNSTDKWQCVFVSEPHKDIAILLIEHGLLRPAQYILDQQGFSDRIAPYVEAQKIAAETNRGLWASDRDSAKSLIDKLSVRIENAENHGKKIDDIVKKIDDKVTSNIDDILILETRVEDIEKDLEDDYAGVCALLDGVADDTVLDTCDSYEPEFTLSLLAALVGAGGAGLVSVSSGLRARRKAHKKLARAARDLAEDLEKRSFNPGDDRSEVPADLKQFDQHKSTFAASAEVANLTVCDEAKSLLDKLTSLTVAYKDCVDRPDMHTATLDDVLEKHDVKKIKLQLRTLANAADAKFRKSSKLSST